jgi:dTDP-4-amino-4,6-dideoxygalactose transaminase
MKTIPFGLPSIDKEEINAVKRVIQSKWIGSGPITQDFEKKFNRYKKSKYSLSVNSCTAGLHLSLIVLGIKQGDEVITTPLTFCSTINSILLVGAKPVLVDINKETFNFDENKIEQKITKKTKALIVVHYAGLPCNMNPILKIAKKYNLKIIEDCAHSIESKYYNKNVGNFGETGCHSFYATKNLTTGEGGMITTNNKKISERLNIMRLHGISKDAWKRHLPENVKVKNNYEHYDVKEIGHKYNMTDLSASMGLVQLKKLDKNWKLRKKIYEYYSGKLKHLPVLLQKIDSYPVKHAYHLFTLVINNKKTKKKRDNLITFLKKQKINTGVNYRSVTEMTLYKKTLGWNDKTCVNSNYVGKNTVSLPLYPTLKKNEMIYICKKVCEFFEK